MLKNTALALAALLPLAACNDDGFDRVNRDLDFYVTDGAALYSLNSDEPLEVRRLALTGLNANTILYGMDFNPRGNVLNGIGSDGQSYLIDPGTGAVTAKGTPDTSVSFANKRVEIDYNPTVANQQVYRVTSDAGDNYRRNDSTGAKVGTDTGFAYRTGDVNAGKRPVVSGIAYTNSQLNTAVPASTTVYAIDSQNDVLTILGGNPASGTAGSADNPNGGQLTTVGSLGIDLVGEIGFDIQGAATGYVTAFANGTYNLYAIDLASGKLSFVGAVNPKVIPVRAFAIPQR